MMNNQHQPMHGSMPGDPWGMSQGGGHPPPPGYNSSGPNQPPMGSMGKAPVFSLPRRDCMFCASVHGFLWLICCRPTNESTGYA